MSSRDGDDYCAAFAVWPSMARIGVLGSVSNDHRLQHCRSMLAVHRCAGGVGDEVADEAQSQALRKGRMKKLKAFRKSPDRPPGEVIERRLRRRTDEIAC